jgi:hypothetical protein
MGIQFYGLEPSQEVGQVFGSSYFRMTPLMFLVDDFLRGEPNYLRGDENIVSADKARAIGEKIEERLNAGAYEAYMAAGKHETVTSQFLDSLRVKYERIQREAQPQPSALNVAIQWVLERVGVKRTDMSDDMFADMPERPTKERVQWLAEFLKNCGGFRVSY